MEYYQLTLNDWLDMKQKIQQELLGVKRSFVRIGYLLRKVEESRGYENDGYKSIAEWAKAEYGMEGSTVSRFMSINKAYSIDGYSEVLLPEYEDFKRSQLEEMLTLPEKDREMIRPETPRAAIRDLKDFNKQTPAAGQTDDLRTFVERFFAENREMLKDIYAVFGDPQKMKEAANPAGNRVYRRGYYILMMYDEYVMVKKFGTDPTKYTWDEFFNIMGSIYGTELEEDNPVKDIMPEPVASAQNTEEIPVNTDKEEPLKEENTDEGNSRTEVSDRDIKKDAAGEPERPEGTGDNNTPAEQEKGAAESADTDGSRKEYARRVKHAEEKPEDHERPEEEDQETGENEAEESGIGADDHSRETAEKEIKNAGEGQKNEVGVKEVDASGGSDYGKDGGENNCGNADRLNTIREKTDLFLKEIERKRWGAADYQIDVIERLYNELKAAEQEA